MVSRHLDKFIFQFAWTLLNSVVFFLGGQPLPESSQVYAFVSEFCESFFKVKVHLLESRLFQFNFALKRIFERSLLLQINDPLVI